MKKKLYKMDKEGNLKFNTRDNLHRLKYKSDSIFNQTWFLVVIVGACIFADYASLSSLFASFLYDNEILRNICVIGMLITLEVAPIYFGFNLKRRTCGYNVSKISIIAPLTAFVVGAVINIILRVETRSLAFPDLADTTTSVLGGFAESENSRSSIVYAWFFGLLPICTSIVAFIATYSISNPLKSELQKLEKMNIELTDQIDQLDAVLAEYDDDYFERLMADDEAKFNAALRMNNRQRDEYFDYCRQRISEHLGTASAIGYTVEHTASNHFEEDNI